MITGWDLGGAHLKAVALHEDGTVRAAVQIPCKLWMGESHLAAALRSVSFASGASLHAVTMTGELADFFPDRATGVQRILAVFQDVLGEAPVRVYSSRGFLAVSDACRAWRTVASANWFAPATCVAPLVPSALVVDVGSTTTDITCVSGGYVVTPFEDDHRRLRREALVYTGVARTPLMAVAQHVTMRGERTGVMNELFATTADLYRLSGQLPAVYDQHDTADGRGRSAADCMRRLARMVGCDLGDADSEQWRALARSFAMAQRQTLAAACERQISGSAGGRVAAVVGLGLGAFLAEEVARSLGLPYRPFAELAGVAAAFREPVQVCAPAFAVARLAGSPWP